MKIDVSSDQNNAAPMNLEALARAILKAQIHRGRSMLTIEATHLNCVDTTAISLLDGGAVLILPAPPRIVLYGPYLNAKDGIYSVVVEGDFGADCGAEVEVYSDTKMFFKGSLTSLRAGKRLFLKGAIRLEFRIYSSATEFVLRKLILTFLSELSFEKYLADAEILEHAERRLSSFPSIPKSGHSLPRSDRTLLASLVWNGFVVNPHVVGTLCEHIGHPTADEIANWVSAQKPAKVINVRESVLFGSAEDLEDIGLIPSVLNLLSSDKLSSEAFLAHRHGEDDVQTALAKASFLRSFRRMKSPYMNEISEFQCGSQMRAAFTGSMNCLCPFTGVSLSSSHSYLVAADAVKQVFTFTRFESVDTFYLVHGTWLGARIFIYLPRIDIVVALECAKHNWGSAQNAIDAFKTLVLLNPLAAAGYLGKKTKTVALSGTMENLGHFFWNELSGLHFADENGFLGLIDRVVCYKHAFVDPRCALNNRDSISLTTVRTPAELFALGCDEGLFCLRLTSVFVEDGMTSRLRAHCLLTCSSQQMTLIKEARAYDYVLWVNLRSHNKVWQNQVEGISAAIDVLAAKYGRVAVFADGMRDCEGVLSQLSEQLPEVKFFNGLGISVAESICWAFAIDGYIVTIGSGLTLVTWIANKPGIAVSERAHLSQMTFWNEVRTGCLMPLHPKVEEITDLGEDAYCNYTIASTVIANLAQAL